MTKKEYLDKLAKELGSMSYNDVKDILNDIEEHFNESMLAGKTEEEAAAQLGDPKDLAADYKEGMSLPMILSKKAQKEAKPKVKEPSSGTVMFVVLMTVFVAIPAWFTLFGIILCIALAELAVALGSLAILATFWSYGSFLVSGLLLGLTLLFLAIFGYAVCYFSIKYFVLGTKWYIESMKRVWHNGL
ncbi:MAG: DUF1700 domain-containing protein [Clostridiales bacterium]|nr:DUF1700 domain-containing protein [Clostridiales bacterium]